MKETCSRFNGRSPLRNKLTKTILGLFTAAQIAFSPIAFNNTALAAPGDGPDSPAVILYDNGPLATGATSRSGVAAPTGTQWSEAQSNYGSTTESNTLAGAGCQTIGTTTSNRCADDFTVPAGQTWTINTVTVFAYQTGFTGANSPVTAGTLRIHNGRPGDAGSTVVFGDLTTNRLGSSTFSNIYRIFNSTTPAPGSAPGTTRRIWEVNLTVSPALVLTAGTYWIDFSINAGTTGNFTPTVSLVNSRGAVGWNGLQSVNGGAAWAPLIDDGNPATAADYIQDFPFRIDGTATGAPAIPRRRTMDFNGDNRSDFVVVRSANATSPSTWWILYSGTNTSTSFQWGTGVGQTGGDVAVPEDYDGDGKTDIAVWRASGLGTAGRSYFFILQSTNNTVRSEQFGSPGDDPTVVDDYDGDGRADLAVYRSGATGNFYYRPSGTAGVDFRTIQWGTTGDKPYPGDFDGDGRADAAVVRNSSGNALILVNGTTSGFQATTYGQFTDRFVSGDWNGDFRNGFAVVRPNATNMYQWYVRENSGQMQFPLIGNSPGDIITPGDYDGDNVTDYAVYRNGTFFVYPTQRSAPFAVQWGQAGDFPVASTQVR